jgi:hypothetical protein
MNDEIFLWSSDLEDFTGEGLLARCFIENIFKNKNNLKIVSNNSIYLFNKNKFSVISKKKYKNNFFYKYINCFKGIILIWYYHLKGVKTCYVNYLPLWNILIFLLLPSKTILGPITGNVYYNKVNSFNSFLRKKIFPILYILSLKLIFNKYKFYIFSTENLKKYIPSDFYNLCLFNFCLLFYKKRKIRKKNIDIVFYLRSRTTKSLRLIEFLIKKLYHAGIKLIVVGDKFVYENVKSYENVSRKKLITILDRVSFSFNPGDNFYSLFLLDCVSCNQTVFYNNIYQKNMNLNTRNFLVPLNFSNFNECYKNIYSKIKKNKYYEVSSKKKLFLNEKKKIREKINIFFDAC